LTSFEGAALRLQVPAGIAIWAPNALFTLVGGGFLVATAREWRPPALPLLWRLLEALGGREPRHPMRHGRLHESHPARHSTHIVDRYLVREYLTFTGFGLAVAAVLSVVIDLLQPLDRSLRFRPPLPSIAHHFPARAP